MAKRVADARTAVQAATNEKTRVAKVDVDDATGTTKAIDDMRVARTGRAQANAGAISAQANIVTRREQEINDLQVLAQKFS